MVPNPDAWTVVLAGSWNPRIFSPPWMMSTLFNQSEDTKFELDVTLGGSSLKFRYAGIVVIPTSSRLIVGVDSNAEKADWVNSLVMVQSVSIGALKALPHTPMTAVGINFGFDSQIIPKAAMDLFEAVGKTSPIDDLGKAVIISEVIQTLRWGENGRVNLKMSRDVETGQFGLRINFHFNAGKTSDAISALNKGVPSFLTEAKKLVSRLED